MDNACKSCGNAIAKQVFFNGLNGIYSNPLCNNCVDAFKKQCRDLNIMIEEKIKELEPKKPWWKRLWEKCCSSKQVPRILD